VGRRAVLAVVVAPAVADGASAVPVEETSGAFVLGAEQLMSATRRAEPTKGFDSVAVN